MKSFTCIFVAVLAVLCSLSGRALAQNIVNCTMANSMNLTDNVNQLAGDWYEVAQNPAPAGKLACVQLKLTVNNETLTIDDTYADTDKLSQHQTVTSTVSLNETSSAAGFQLTFMKGNTTVTNEPTIYKLLATDFTNYAFICAYSNSTNATEFGMVFTREREPNNTMISNFESMAASNFSNFLNGSMTKITQNSHCSGASSSVPFAAAILAAIYALLNFVH